MCDVAPQPADGGLDVGDLFGVLANTGRTPATQMVVQSLVTDRKKSDPIPDIDCNVIPEGTFSVTVTVPLVGPAPVALLTVTE